MRIFLPPGVFDAKSSQVQASDLIPPGNLHLGTLSRYRKRLLFYDGRNGARVFCENSRRDKRLQVSIEQIIMDKPQNSVAIESAISREQMASGVIETRRPDTRISGENRVLVGACSRAHAFSQRLAQKHALDASFDFLAPSPVYGSGKLVERRCES